MSLDVPHNHAVAPAAPVVNMPYDLSQKIHPEWRPMEKYRLPVR